MYFVKLRFEALTFPRTATSFMYNCLGPLPAFLLQGLPSNGTLTAVMAYMVEDFYRPDAIMDFPKGGSGAIAAALERGVTKRQGCSVRTRTSVEEVLVVVIRSDSHT